MTIFYLVFAVAGGALLALQLLMGVAGASDFHLPGMDADAAHGVEAHASDALDLFSFRALTAAGLLFGLTGLLLLNLGLGPLSLLPAAAVGIAAAYLVARSLHAMEGMETDGAERLEEAVGRSATVYLSIPGERRGAGKVHLTLAGRTVECRAQAEAALPSGASVLVIDVIGPDLVEVIPSPSIGV